MKVFCIVFAIALASCSGSTNDKVASKVPVNNDANPIASGKSRNSEDAKEPEALIDQKYGFRDHRFGDDISSFTGLELAKKQVLHGEAIEIGGPIEVYNKSIDNENLKIGSNKLWFINYVFYNDKFWKVEIRVAPTHAMGMPTVVKEDPMNVLLALKSLYGPADSVATEKFEWASDDDDAVYYWTGKKAVATLQRDYYAENVFIVITSKIIMSQIEKDVAEMEKQEGANAKSDL